MVNFISRGINGYTWGVAVFASVGSMLYGIDSGIISTTIGHESFLEYFDPFTPNIKGAVVSTFAGGSFFGVIFAGWANDFLGRKKTIYIAAFISLVAGIIQAASVHVGMLIAGRIVGGFSVGILNCIIPIYESEISPPAHRGLISGLHSQFVGIGFAIANWVGFGCSYASGDFQWRFPLAFQCIPSLLMLAGTWALPESPRWLIEKEREDEAYRVIKRLHSNAVDETLYKAEFNQIREQLRFEKASNAKSWKELFYKPSNRKRLILAMLVQAFTQLTGINVINYYQITIYNSLGMYGHMAQAMAGIYGLCGPAANLICIFFVDKWGRRITLIITSFLLAIDMSIVMALIATVVDGGNNKTGQGFTLLFIFLFTIIYSLGYNAIHYIYVPEIMNQAVRSRGTAIATDTNVAINVMLNQVSPIAFAHVEWRYYSLFIATNITGAIVVWWLFPETKGKTLEEINELFGDEVMITLDEAAQATSDDDLLEEKAVDTEHKETTVKKQTQHA
ncbi:hypothetical protein CANCADRAFT_103965 [Tortispora caseinolytica NRRL Y-17796]|uniref:Major facilitator superfamily (MFS) profile domain-containing protein n=1 Tax=Tortispora caseinolytica NRRL Y-17796 TaxID=767744 RepID=A0A1E4TEP8_9ASCO|nr:hypothetical protein CANCADRAFT_103965 [Tortispora caseinolytica NRRL Y-17796]